MASDFLSNLENMLDAEIFPIVNPLDEDLNLMMVAFEKYRAAGFFRVYLPEAFGGIKLCKTDIVRFQLLLGEKAGALAFLQAQASVACQLIALSDNQKIKQSLFEKIYYGELAIGNSIHQVKPKYKAPIIAQKYGDGFILNGVNRFCSGYQLFDKVVLSATCDDQEIFFILDFCSSDSVIISDRINVIGMDSMNTVSIEFNEHIIKRNNILLVTKKGWLFGQYANSPVLAYPVGVIKAVLSSLLAQPHLKYEYKHMCVRLNTINDQLISEMLSVDPKGTDRFLSKLFVISNQIMSLALLIGGGKGLTASSPLQRLYRELPIWFLSRSYPEVINEQLSAIELYFDQEV